MSTDAPQPYPSVPTPPPIPGYTPPEPPTQAPSAAPTYGQSSPAPAPTPGYGSIPAAPVYNAATAEPAYVPGYPTPYGQPVLAEWGLRAKGALIDWIAPMVGYFILYAVGMGLIGAGAESNSGGMAAFGSIVVVIAVVALLGVMVYNNMVLQGKTGQTWGKKWAGTKLIREDTGQTPGIGLCVGRWFAHYIDNLACYIIGWVILPLTQPKKQTISDMICKTIVVKI